MLPSEEAPPTSVVTVKVARAVTADLQLTIQAPATIFPREQANISARITAPILNLKARKGDTITAGQILAVLESKDVEAQHAEASANLADAEATLQKMSAGTLPADVERARGQVRTAEAALSQAQKNYDRRKDCSTRGDIPIATYCERDGIVAGQDGLRRRTKDAGSSRTTVRQDGCPHRREPGAASQGAPGSRERATAVHRIRSPLAGSVTEQFLYPGDMAKPDSPIFTVMDLSVAVARAQVPEGQTRDVWRAAKRAPLDAPIRRALPRGRTVTVVNQAVDPARRTVEVWCEIPNPRRTSAGGLIWLGHCFGGKGGAGHRAAGIRRAIPGGKQQGHRARRRPRNVSRTCAK